ncbi:MAG: hypothetical protein ABSC53_06630 [Bacteroidota bacterium]
MSEQEYEDLWHASEQFTRDIITFARFPAMLVSSFIGSKIANRIL